MRTLLLLGLVAVLTLNLSACGDKRDLPADKIITIYNGNLEETRKLDILDTLYVRVVGLKPGSFYTVEALDPSGGVISVLEATADENGIIAPAPLWYDVGLIDDGTGTGHMKPDFSGAALNLSAFHVRVYGDGETDYREPFYIVTTDNLVEQPRPIVWATSSPVPGADLENAFEETGTKDPAFTDGRAGKTKVYVDARSIPASIDGSPVNFVDVYILPAKGPAELWQDGDVLTGDYVVRKLNIPLSAILANGSKAFTAPQLVWDLDDGINTLINPGEDNAAYDVVLDVNQNGLFDFGQDLDADGVTDRYIDGADGQGVAGFIVTNTPANDFFATVTDASGNPTDTVVEAGCQLSISMKNLPPDTVGPLNLNLLQGGVLDYTVSLTVQPKDVAAGIYLPYVASTLFVDTANGALTPAGLANAAIQSYTLQASNGYSSDLKVLHLPTTVIPTDVAGSAVSEFDESGTAGGQTRVYAIATGIAGNAMIYVYPHMKNRPNGFDLVNGPRTTVTSVSFADSGNPVLVWDLNGSPTLENPSASNNAYDLILDQNNDGLLDSGDAVESIGFVVRNTTTNNVADVIFANIASGGIFTWNGRGYDYDYRDTFRRDGRDTKSAYYGNTTPDGYGIKAIWNPYLQTKSGYGRPNKLNLGALGSTSSYSARAVDVYIVDASTADLSPNAVLNSGGNVDVVNGRKKTLPVQYSCQNGMGQQNIWTPYFTPGRYFVIVDVNRDGLLTEGLDIVDAVRKDGTTIEDDPSVAGFAVE